MESSEHVLSALNFVIKEALQSSQKHQEAVSAGRVKAGFKDWAYFPTSRKDFKLFSRAFGNLLHKQNYKLHQHIVQLQVSQPEPIWTEWLANFFVGLLPQEFVWRVLDAFVLDGFRALFRIGIAFFTLEKAAILKCTSLDQVLAIIAKIPSMHGELLFTTAWAIKIPSADIRGTVESHSSLIGISQSDDLHEIKLRYQRALPKIQLTPDVASLPLSSQEAPTMSTIMKDEYWIAMWSWIPPKLRLDELGLAFTTKEHGYNLTTMLQTTIGKKPLILVIQTSDSVFGAFLTEPWPQDDASRGRFYGTGECFIFTLRPFAKLYPWVGRELDETTTPTDEKKAQELAERRAAIEKTSSFFIMSTKREIVVGGGGGRFGIWLDEDLHKGTTDNCLTFGNDPLTGNGDKEFECLNLEVYAFQ
ncbi:hypothetical protein HDU97_006217 [Phlyctochytrium planicorne]|nr:hypothetical protein HDU97_006217 [Phlyctochytrium planicorne]